MGIRTGSPRGRPKGAKNLRTRVLERKTAETAERLEAILPDCFTGDAHAFLMAIYKDNTQDTLIRLDAAKAAIRYETPALANMEIKNETTVRTVAHVPVKAESVEVWQKHIQKLGLVGPPSPDHKPN